MRILPLALSALLLLSACNGATGRDPVNVIDGGSLPSADAELIVPGGAISDDRIDVVIDPDGDSVQTAPGPGGLIEREPDTCGASTYQDYVGQPAAAFPDPGRPLRVIAPGAIITQEYDPSRVNLTTDADGTILRITCG